MKKEDGSVLSFIRRPIKTAAWAAIWGIAGSIILSVLQMILLKITQNVWVNETFSYLSAIFCMVAFLLVLNGFYALGVKHNNTLLRIISLLLIIFAIISFMAVVTSNFVYQDLGTQILEKFASLGIDPNSESLTSQQAIALKQEVLPMVLPILFWLIFFLIISCVLTILFGAGLIKLGNNVQLAKVAGILAITGASSLLLLVGFMFGIGFLLILASYALGIIILFKESKKEH